MSPVVRKDAHANDDHCSDIHCGCVHLPVIPHMFKSIERTTQNPLQHIRALVAKGGKSNVSSGATIMHNGTIRTMRNGDATATVDAIAFNGNTIVKVGSLQNCKLALPGANVVDLGGKTMLPGLIEPHIHLLSSAIFGTWLDVSPFEGQDLRKDYSLQWCYDKMKKQLSTNGAKGGWLLAFGLDPSLFQTGDIKEWQNPTSTDLDKNISSEDAIVIVNASGHIAYANTKALSLADYNDSDGILLELEEMSPVVLKAVEAQNENTMELLKAVIAEMNEVLSEAASRGVTMMWDAALGVSSSRIELDMLDIVFNTHFCPVRYGGAVLFTTEKDYTNWIVNAKLHPDSYSSDNFRVSCAKIVSDGSNQGQTGYQEDNYPNPDQYVNVNTNHLNGVWNIRLPLFDRLVRQLDGDGWNLMIHANGDKALKRTLAAYSRAIDRNQERERRHRIEHCSLMDWAKAAEMNRLGISPSFLIGHVGYWGYTFANKVWDMKKASLMDSTKTALKNNLRFTLHSDHFVSPLGPLRMLEQAVSRKMEFPDANGAVLNAEECVTIAEGLKAITYDAAWQCGADDICGSLEMGKKADFVIVEKDPMKWSKDGVGLRNLKVIQTWMDGRCTYDSTA
eukprot:TRINITY_DN70557_c0_g1_i1.p1 TRINITY_DN70557_c0_g1~~TRINITY_DN70557_c0_g1_i1.p1  ORF type:complete len:620 (+),score=75.83 TRINITY_DN70557_c0_g1_i1:282-2141(+)